MHMRSDFRKAANLGLTLLLVVSLAGCILLPGKFAASLDIRRDGHFTYTYKGEILMLGLTRLAQIALAPKEAKEFAATPCYKDDGTTERTCTKQELADQKVAWEEEQTQKANRAKEMTEMVKKALGGIDPNDPKAAEELASRLRGQVGWKSVEYKGNGTYLVDFQISGNLDRDFTFPSVERLPGTLAYLTVNRRANGEVRIDSPIMQYAAFGTAGGSSAQVIAQAAGLNKGEQWPDFPQAEGHFTLTTDGVILANNTEHGPTAVATGKQLDWDISGHNPIPPYALIGLGK